MKKFILILLMTFTLTSFFAINIFAINVDYTFNITDNKKWNLETGSIENDLKFAVTSKMIIKDDRIITSSETYHHVVFWNSKNQFLGYKNSQYSILENDYFLGNIEYGSAGFDAPANAHFFSFMIYKSGNAIPIAELNNQSLSDIFDNFSHQGNDTPLSTLNDQSLNDVFNTGNLITNHDFSNGSTGWTLSNASVVNGQAYIDNTINTGNSYLLQHGFNTTDTYYVYAEHNVIQGTIWYATSGGINYTSSSLSYHSRKGTFTATYFVVGRYTSNTQAYVDNVYAVNMSSLGITGLTENEMYNYLDAYQRTNNNEPINDIVSEYAIEYAIANNPTINLTYNEWYDYYNNYLTYQDANDRIESGLNNLTLNDVFLDGNLFTSFNVTNVNALYSINNDILTITDNTNSFQYLSIFNYDGSASINHIFYSAVEFATNDTNSNNRRLRLFDDVTLEYATTTFLKQNNNFEYFSVLGEKTQNDLDILVYNAIGAGTQNNDTLIRDVILLDLTALDINNLSQAQMDAYHDDYIDNQTLEQNLYLQALTPTSFDLIDPNYDYTAPPPDDFLDVDSDTFLDNLLTNIGFNNDLGKVTLSILILFLTTLTLIKFNLGTSVILGVDILVYVGLTFLGWLPAWINILIALIIMVLFYLRFKGGGSNNEESD